MKIKNSLSFAVERMLLNTETNRNMYSYQTGSNSFLVLLCIDGCGVIKYEKEKLSYCKGDCIFIPVDSVELKLHGKAQVLGISC